MSTPLVKYSVSVATTSATVNATIVPKSGLVLVDIYKNAASATVAYIATQNVKDGACVMFRINKANTSLTFNELGNLKMLGTSLGMGDQWDMTEFCYNKSQNKWACTIRMNND